MTGTIAIVLQGYPRLSETFIAQEIHALERRGFALRIYSLRHPTDTSIHPGNRLVVLRKLRNIPSAKNYQFTFHIIFSRGL